MGKTRNGIGFGYRTGVASKGSLLNQIPAHSLATLWLDGSITQVGSDYYFVDKIAGNNVLITGYDFPAGWVKGFPYKSAATIDVFGQTGVPVNSLLNCNFDYGNQYFAKVIAATYDGNGIELTPAYVSEIVAYSAPLTGTELTSANTFFGTPAKLTSAVKWVDGSFGGTSTGSESQPYKTLITAESGATAEDTIYVKSGSGVYTEGAYWNPKKHLNWIFIGNSVIKSTGASYCAFVELPADHYIKGATFDGEAAKNLLIYNYQATLFKNCRIINPKAGATAIYCNYDNSKYENLISTGGITIDVRKSIEFEGSLISQKILSIVATDHLNIKNSKLLANSGNTVESRVSANHTIIGSIIENSGNYSAAILGKTDNVATTINISETNFIQRASAVGYGLRVGQEDTSVGNNSITSINISKSKFLGIRHFTPGATATSHGLMVGFQGVTGLLKYRFIDGHGIGLVLKGSNTDMSNLPVIYSVVKNSKSYGVYFKGVINSKIYGKTLINNGEAFHYTINTGADGATGQTINNCIAIEEGNGYLHKMDELSASGHSIDYNIYYSPLAKPFSVGGVTKTFEEWQALGYDAHSIMLPTLAAAKALFTDYDNGDYSLAAGSAAIGAGVALDAAYNNGLDASTDWGSDSELPVIVTKQQGAAWDCGAYVH